jgi:hypothetical protein
MEPAELLSNTKGSSPNGQFQKNTPSLEELRIEACIFQHLGSHRRAVQFFSRDSEQFILRTEHMKNGNLEVFISSKESSTQEECYWIEQARGAIQVLYSRGERS